MELRRSQVVLIETSVSVNREQGEEKMRFVIACVIAVMAAACGQTLENPSSPTSLGDTPSVSGGERVSMRQAGIQCSDAPVQWITTNFSPVGRSAHVLWVPVPNITTYEVEVYHTRDEQRFPKKFVYSFKTNRTDAYIDDREDGGRYFVRVRVLNSCGGTGAWSATLIIYLDGGPQGGTVTEPPYEPPYEPPTDDPPSDECNADEDDGNNGHGNDCDHDDDSNPS